MLGPSDLSQLHIIGVRLEAPYSSKIYEAAKYKMHGMIEGNVGRQPGIMLNKTILRDL